MPHGVAVDPLSGKVFVADTNNHRVLRYASLATLTNGAAAEAVLGQPTFVSNARLDPPTAASMSKPENVVVDGNGRLWVADTWNDRVLRFDDAANKASGANADGVLGQPNFTSDNDVTTQNGMAFSIDVAVDSSGRLWVADLFNNRVLRFDNAGGKANGANADGVIGQPNFGSSSNGTTRNQLNFVDFGTSISGAGIATDGNGRLWVADTANHRVLLFRDSTAVVTACAVEGPTNAATVNFNVTFGKAVTGVSASNFVLSTDGITSGATIGNVSGSGTNWTVTVTTGPTATVDIALNMVNSSGVADLNGNPVGGLPYTGTATCAVDRTAPTATIRQIAPRDTGPTGDARWIYQVTFSEPVAGFTFDSLDSTNLRFKDIIEPKNSSGKTFFVVGTPARIGKATFEIPAGVVQDAAGNSNLASSQLAREFTADLPTPYLWTPSAAEINSGPIPVLVTFDQSVTGFTSSDLTITNATVSNFVASSNGVSYTFDLNPTAEGTVTVSVPAGVARSTRAGAAPNNVSEELSVEYDLTGPTVTAMSV